MNFNHFKDKLHMQFKNMSKHELFYTGINKDQLWETYLSSFPTGSNPIFRERTEHDCQCCKQFIRACGDVVTIINNQLVSIWDLELDDPNYQVVTNTMATLVKSQPITNVFRHYQAQLGTNFNFQALEDGNTIQWDHFHFHLPAQFILHKDSIGTKLAEFRANHDVFARGLKEITLDALETVLELIDQNSLYRGEEHKTTIKFFLTLKRESTLNNKLDLFAWLNLTKSGARIRNTAIGTLLLDISAEMDLNQAVGKFETMVAPTNYKRPTALITKSMIAKAKQKIIDLGFESALERRFATVDDLTINNILFADREAKAQLDVFDELEKSISVNSRNFDHIETVSINTFITSILPKAESSEIMFENNHTNNLMTLIAPVTHDAANIFKWHNNFSWAYSGDVADSIKERVKRAGGRVDGVLRCSLSWFNYDDLDIHVQEPDQGAHIYFGNSYSSYSKGQLDVDMNASGANTRSGVENITWPRQDRLLEGIYKVWINQFAKRESKDLGFDVEIEFNGVIHSFYYDKAVIGNVPVAEFKYTHANGIEFISSLPSSQSSKEIWNITTNQFHKVSMIMNSPNHWDNHTTGNKHWFFILTDCQNPSSARGFFNEFLAESLTEHRKVFEVLGSKTLAQHQTNQLSGLGFSLTKRASLICKLTGSFTRTIKITF